LALALAFDAFAVSVAVGIRRGGIDRWTVFRVSWHFGFAQFAMPIVGWVAGEAIARAIGAWGQWIAAAILFAIGARLIWEQYRGEEQQWKGDPTRGSSLIVLMFATSIDALAAGLSLALVGARILYPAITIGVVCAVMSGLGLWFGHAVGLRFSRGAAVFGGFILIGLAVKTALG
jgi:putative Mn2+ efflux pump MntP